MRKTEPHFNLTQLIAKAIDLGVNAEPIQRTALQLEVQALAITQEARVLPAALPADAVA